MSTISKTMTIRSLTCGSCGVLFGLESLFMSKRQDDGRSFYCPNGHHISWQAANEAEATERQLRAAKTRQTALEDQLRAATRDAETARSELLRVQSRIANGVCPCCNRTFPNVRAHMQSNHPDFAVELPKGHNVTYRCSCGYRAETFKGLRIHQGKNRGAEWDQPDTRRWNSHLTVV